MDGKALLKTALLHSRGSGVQLRDLKAAVRRSLDKGHLILGTLEYRLSRNRDGDGMSRAAWTSEYMQEGMTKKQAEAHVRQLNNQAIINDLLQKGKLNVDGG